MPEAIATTKRKFHRLLDTLTSYTNVPVQPLEPATPLTAREKLEQANERVRKRQRQDGSLSSIESRLTQNGSSIPLPRKVLRTSTSKQVEAAKNKSSPPHFSPWSQDTFLKRLHTFSRVSLWHPKPEEIDEVAWAKRGWQCVEVNTVACLNGCGSRVVVDLHVQRNKAMEEEEEDDSDEDDTSLEQALVARYKDEIIEGHSEHCLWRKSGCKDDIYRLQVVRPAVWQPALRSRYQSLQPIVDSIKDITVQQAGIAETKLTPVRLHAELTPEILPVSEAAEQVQARALDIAMHGWRGTSELNAELLNCDACFQRIGLWMYQPGYRARAAMDEDDDNNNSTATIDLLEMHREYCPWRNSHSQQASGTLAGLNASQILSRVVATYLKEKRRKSDEQTMSVEVDELADNLPDTPKLSRQEVEQQDRERESRLQKLKRLLTIKRPSKVVAK